MRLSVILGLSGLMGCSSGTKAPPLASEDCDQPPCQTGIHTGGGGGSTIFDGGEGTLGGSVGVFTDTGFVDVAPYAGSGTIGVFGPVGPPNQASAAFSGSTYVIPDAPLSSVLWADLLPDTTAEVLPTLVAISGAAAGGTVAFASVSAMNQIFAELSRAPQTLNAARGQLIVEFVAASGGPLSDVVITQTPQGSDVAYDSGAAYADHLGGTTGTRGVALILNATAAPFPGGLAVIAFTSGSPPVTGTFDAYLAQGAVTVVSVTPSP